MAWRPVAARLIDLLEVGGLTQAAAAKRLGISQPHVPELKNHKLGRFSRERLLHFIVLMNRHADIFIRPRAAVVPAGSLAGAVINLDCCITRPKPVSSSRA